MFNQVERRAADRITQQLNSMGHGPAHDKPVPSTLVDYVVGEVFSILRQESERRAMNVLLDNLPGMETAFHNDAAVHHACRLIVRILTASVLGDLPLTDEEKTRRNEAAEMMKRLMTAQVPTTLDIAALMEGNPKP